MGWQLSEGADVGGYRIIEPIGRGGMGVVYRAAHPRLQSIVALKLLNPGFADDETFRQRFTLEATLASSLNHPNIIPVYDTGEADGQLYLAMRLVEGPSLREVLEADRRIDAARAVALLAQVASALDAAHARDLVHRDVKPENILIAAGGATEFGEHPYLTDFGVSKQLSGPGPTRTGQMVGTLHYIGPEQVQGQPVDGKCDQYALGCVLYECLSGDVPFARPTDATLLWAHVHDPPPPLEESRPELPSALDAVLRRMLAKSPADRFPTCAAAFVAARAALSAGAAPGAPVAPGPSAHRRVPLAALVTAAGLAAGVAGAYLLTQSSSAAPSPAAAPGASHSFAAGKASLLRLTRRPLAQPARYRPPARPKTTTKQVAAPTQQTPVYSAPTQRSVTPVSTPVHTKPAPVKPKPAPTSSVPQYTDTAIP